MRIALIHPVSFWFFFSILLSAPAVAAECAATNDGKLPSKNMLGKYGFDWHKPDQGRFRRIDEKLAKRFQDCRWATVGAFTGKAGHAACKIKGGEFLIFDSEARCVEEFETMQANAP